MKKILLVTTLFCATVGAVAPAPLDALAQAKAEIDTFVKNSSKKSCDDYTVFLQHFSYYRSWGNYGAAAQTIPYALEEKLTPAIKEVEKRIKAIADAEKKFRQEDFENKTGSSTLNDAGAQFFADILTYAQQQTCPPR